MSDPPIIFREPQELVFRGALVDTMNGINILVEMATGGGKTLLGVALGSETIHQGVYDRVLVTTYSKRTRSQFKRYGATTVLFGDLTKACQLYEVEEFGSSAGLMGFLREGTQGKFRIGATTHHNLVSTWKTKFPKAPELGEIAKRTLILVDECQFVHEVDDDEGTKLSHCIQDLRELGATVIFMTAFAGRSDGKVVPSGDKTYRVSLTEMMTLGYAPQYLTSDFIHVTDLIFGDGFDSGNLTAWSSTANGGHLSVSPAGALVGSNGLVVSIDSTTATYVVDNSPNAEARYRARFHFDPNTITMANGDVHAIFYGYNSANLGLFQISLYYNNGYFVRVGVVDNGTTWRYSPYVLISDAPHYLEIDWRAATGVGANDGLLNFWVDGVQRGNLTGINNDTRRVEYVRLGAVTGIDAGTHGTYYFDAFESRRVNYIGP